jgi:hypothetical protein
MKTIRLSNNLDLRINDKQTEVAINRRDNGSCYIDIEVQDGKLVIVYHDGSQIDSEEN